VGANVLWEHTTRIFIHHEDGGNMHLKNVGTHLADYILSQIEDRNKNSSGLFPAKCRQMK
jgi:hypothetical protein